MPANLSITLNRNGDYYAVWKIRVAETGLPYDLTGKTLESDAVAHPGDTAKIASATITMIDPASGEAGILWRGADFDAHGEKGSKSVVYQDFRITHGDGVKEVWTAGQINLIPGSTGV